MSDNGLLNSVFMAEKEEVSEGWSQLPNKKFYVLYNLPCTIRTVK
jgi:hypothetical protein